MLSEAKHPGRLAALLPLGAIALAVALPFLLRALGLDFYLSLASRIVVYAIAATSLNLVLGYGGHGLVRPCRVLRPRRLRHGDHDQRGRAERPAPPRRDDRSHGARRARHRRDLAAHARRLLHHDHAGLRADAVLPRQLGEGLRRRRGPEHPRPLAVLARPVPARPQEPARALLRRARRARARAAWRWPASRRRASAAPCWRCATTTCAPKRSAFRPIATSSSSSSSPARSAASPAR